MITYTEFIAATMKVVEFLEEHEGQGKIDAIFQQFDTDNDGKISATDIKFAMQKLNKHIDDEEVQETIKKFDTNNDGEIDR